MMINSFMSYRSDTLKLRAHKILVLVSKNIWNKKQLTKYFFFKNWFFIIWTLNFSWYWTGLAAPIHLLPQRTPARPPKWPAGVYLSGMVTRADVPAIGSIRRVLNALRGRSASQLDLRRKTWWTRARVTPGIYSDAAKYTDWMAAGLLI